MSTMQAFLYGWLAGGIFALIVAPRLARDWAALSKAVRVRLERRRLQKQLQALKAAHPAPAVPAAPATPAASTAAPATAPNDGWYSLPGGNRLEYKATGFAIELHPEEKQAPYRLVTPEGFMLTSGQLLVQLKAYGVFAATERAQFEPGAKGGAA